MLKVKFNGIELTEKIIVTNKFTALNGADYSPNLHEYNLIDGSKFLYTRKSAKEIEMPFYIKYNDISEYDWLNSALNVDEPKELEIGYLPNRVYYAIPSGHFNFEEFKLNGRGKINWIVPDGLAHAKTLKKFDFYKNADNIWQANIFNSGNMPTVIDYTIKLKKGSSFIGLVGQYEPLQFGDVDGSTERYPAGALILINGEEGKMSVNNRFADNDEVIGSEYFKAPPGQSTVQLYVSNFSEIEYAYLTIRERWIG